MSICSRQLAPQGVAFVSYNTYPGWHSRGMVRQMVRYHVDASARPLEQVRQAREFLAFLVEHCRDPKSVYNFVLQEEAKIWEKGSDSYLLHEQLAEFNEPLYFHQFVGRLADHELQFIAEAQLSDSPWLMADEMQEKLGAWCGDLVRYEQHLDFLRERTFRRSLICHESVGLDRSPGPELICKFLLAARAMPVFEAPEVESTKAEQFRTHDGISFSTNNPWLKAALVGLFERWPRMFSFDELLELARGKLERSPAAELDPLSDAKLLKQPLLQCGRSGMVELHVRRSPDFAGISDAPRASPLARLQAEQGPFVTNLRHRQMELREFDRQVLQRLDGRRDRAALLVALGGLPEAEALGAERSAESSLHGQSEPSPTSRLDDALGESLRRLAGGGLLAG
jgi:methyltransferase-like protein